MVQHLSFQETKYIISQLKPKTAILTHFGMTMLKAKPNILAEGLRNETGLNIMAAYDGMTYNL
jgi:phosphoribosyl 1,2-cyclic phosphodiesterase